MTIREPCAHSPAASRRLYCFRQPSAADTATIRALRQQGWSVIVLPFADGDAIVAPDHPGLTRFVDGSVGSALLPKPPWREPPAPAGMVFKRVPDGIVTGPAGQAWCIVNLHLAEAPVTNAQFMRFVESSDYGGEGDCPGLDVYRAYDGRYLQALRAGRAGFCDPAAPVVCVSWLNAVAFVDRLTKDERDAGRLPDGWRYRLPTEAEWQHAASLGDRGSEAAFNFAERIGHPTGGGRFPRDAIGLFDLRGNVFEWCANVADPAAQDMPAEREDEGYRANRGGSWASAADSCEVTYRHWNAKEACHDRLGFRVALVQES